jgi:hypothetical protein
MREHWVGKEQVLSSAKGVIPSAKIAFGEVMLSVGSGFALVVVGFDGCGTRFSLSNGSQCADTGRQLPALTRGLLTREKGVP